MVTSPPVDNKGLTQVKQELRSALLIVAADAVDALLRSGVPFTKAEVLNGG